MESFLEGIRVIIITDEDITCFENKENIYVDKSLKIVAYKYSFGMHQECINNFGKNYGQDFTTENDLVKKGNIVFKIAGPLEGGQYIVVNSLPEKMENDTMLAAYLEVINKMKDNKLFIFAAQKFNENTIEKYSFKSDFNENIYCDIVSSYLEKRL